MAINPTNRNSALGSNSIRAFGTKKQNLIIDNIISQLNDILDGVYTMTDLTLTGDLIVGDDATITGDLAVNGTVTASAGFNDQVGTTYLLAASDNGKVVTLNNAAAITLTLPVLAVGFNCSIVQKGAGQVSMVVSGTTLRNRQSHTKLAGQYATASLIVPVTAEWYLSGDTAI